MGMGDQGGHETGIGDKGKIILYIGIQEAVCKSKKKSIGIHTKKPHAKIIPIIIKISFSQANQLSLAYSHLPPTHLNDKNIKYNNHIEVQKRSPYLFPYAKYSLNKSFYTAVYTKTDNSFTTTVTLSLIHNKSSRYSKRERKIKKRQLPYAMYVPPRYYLCTIYHIWSLSRTHTHTHDPSST